MTIENKSPQFGSKPEKLSAEIDPRQDEKFIEQCQKIIKHQYDYFNVSGKGISMNLPYEKKYLENDTLIYQPDLDQYKFAELPGSEKQKAAEAKLNSAMQKVQQAINSLPDIPNFSRDIKMLNINKQDSWKSVGNLKDFLDLSAYLLKFLQSAKDWFSVSREQVKNRQEQQKKALIEHLNLIYVNSSWVSITDIKVLIEQNFATYYQEEQRQLSFSDANFLKNRTHLSDIIGRIKEAIYCIDIRHPKFLSQKYRTPIFFAYWLSGAKESLEQIEWTSLDEYISALKKAKSLEQAEIWHRLENDILSKINFLINERRAKKQAQKEGTTETQKDVFEDETKLPWSRRWKMEALRNYYKTTASKKEKIKTQELEMRQQAQEYHKPSSELKEKQEYPKIAFNPIEEEMLYSTKGRIETWDSALQNNKLFITGRVDLAKTGFARIASKSIKPVENLLVFSLEETVNQEKSIIHLPCAKGEHISLPIPAGYDVLSIGWSETDPAQNIESVSVSHHTEENVYTFTSPADGFIHYSIEIEEEQEAVSQAESTKYLKTFESIYDSLVIKNIIEQAKILSSTEEQISYIVEELYQRRIDFIYSLGSDLLDELYNNLGAQKFYALVENIGIGDCQIFSAIMAHIFRQADIPARVVPGENSSNSAFKVIGHAKVEYCDEQEQKWQEFEATIMADPISRRVKNEADLNPEERSKFLQFAQTAIYAQNPDEFKNACFNIKNLLIEQLPELEQKAKRLDEFTEKHKQMHARGLKSKNFTETAKNIYEMFQLGVRYDRFRILDLGLSDLTEQEKKKYKKYINVFNPYKICSQNVFNFLSNELQANNLSETEFAEIMDNLICFTDSDREWQGREVAKNAVDLLRNNQKDILSITKAPHIITEMTARFRYEKIFDAKDVKNDLEVISVLVHYANQENQYKPEIWQILLNFLDEKSHSNEILLNSQEEAEQQQIEKFIKRNKESLKTLLVDYRSWPGYNDWETNYRPFIQGGHAIIIEQDREKLAYQLLKERVPLNDINQLSILNYLWRIGLLEFKPNLALAELRKEAIKHLQIILEDNLRRIVDSPSIPIFQPFIRNRADIENFNPEQADLFLRNIFTDNWRNKSVSRDVNEYFLTALDYFPELTLDDNLIIRWNQKFEQEKQKNTLEIVEYRLASQNNYEFQVRPLSGGSIGFDFFRISSFLPEELSNKIIGGECFSLLKDLQGFLRKPTRDNEENYEKCLIKIITSDDKVQAVIQNDFTGQKEHFFKAILLYFFGNTSRSSCEYFRLCFVAEQANQAIPKEVPSDIKSLYQKFPKTAIQEFFTTKMKEWSDASFLFKPEFFKKMQALESGKTRETIWSHLAEEQFNYHHPFGVINKLNLKLFKLLEQTDPDRSGEQFRKKLDELQKTFKNNLGKYGEMINILHKLPKSGYEFADLREYQTGDDIRLIDTKASARVDKNLVKQTYQEQEPKNNVFIINLDTLLANRQKKFIPYSKWGEILENLYNSAFSLMIFLSQPNQPKKININVYFHGNECLNIALPFNKIQPADRFTKIRNALMVVFAEINKFLPLLQKEYEIAKIEKQTPFLKHQPPDIRVAESTHLIGLEKDAQGLVLLSRAKKTAASRLVI